MFVFLTYSSRPALWKTGGLALTWEAGSCPGSLCWEQSLAAPLPASAVIHHGELGVADGGWGSDTFAEPSGNP